MTVFEQSVEDNKRDVVMEGENVIEFLKNSDTATLSFSQGKWMTKIRKLAEKYPDDVKIINDSGKSLVAHIPVDYIKINNSKHNISEGYRDELRNRASNMRLAKEKDRLI